MCPGFRPPLGLLQVELWALADRPTSDQGLPLFRYACNTPQRINVAPSLAGLRFPAHKLADDLRDAYAAIT